MNKALPVVLVCIAVLLAGGILSGKSQAADKHWAYGVVATAW